MPYLHAGAPRDSYNDPLTTKLPPELGTFPPFSLFMSGVAGWLCGDHAVSAMTAVHVYGNRRWLGWYNTPGSLRIAKRLNSFAKPASFRNFFSSKPSKSVKLDPTPLLGLDGYKGPKFRAAYSGTIMEETSYLAALFMKECAARSEKTAVGRWETQPIGITIADLDAAEEYPAGSDASTPLFSTIPIIISGGTCVVSALFGDWYAFSLILIGLLASGVSSIVLSWAEFAFSHPVPAQGSPPGDGILGSDKDIVLLRGTEGAVNSITRGKFTLDFLNDGHCSLARWCSVLFFVQFITQLFLIPQASLFGQIMFLVSICVSALYNAWLSSFDKEMIHRRFLFERVLKSPKVTKYRLRTRTAAAVFILLVLQLQDPTRLLSELLPNDTKVWNHWKTTILKQLGQPSDQSFEFEGTACYPDGITQDERNLLKVLYEDARAAYEGYKNHLEAN